MNNIKKIDKKPQWTEEQLDIVIASLRAGDSYVAAAEHAGLNKIHVASGRNATLIRAANRKLDATIQEEDFTLGWLLKQFYLCRKEAHKIKDFTNVNRCLENIGKLRKLYDENTTVQVFFNIKEIEKDLQTVEVQAIVAQCNDK